MEERATLGPILPHTEAKHDILRYHLNAWFPILGRSFSGPLQYIDGFAGPGEYLGGEPGSPIIALRSVLSNRYFEEFNRNSRRFQFLFVEEDSAFVTSLRDRVADTTWPDTFDLRIEHGEFERIMAHMLDERARRMPPTVLFIDPFGSAGFTMSILERLSHLDRVDILINFNYLDLNRWILPDPTKHGTLDGLYGSNHGALRYRWKATNVRSF